ncbi:MAG: LysR family transcriptional regulator [Pseudomonadota bacterium]
MYFEIKQLRHFVSVVETGNITRAAELQHITQPALTRSVRNMEERIGGDLLNRQHHSITPTEAGEVLYQYAKLIIRQAELAISDVKAISKGHKGHVHVGIAALFAPTLAGALASHLAKVFPELQVRLTEGFFEDLVAQLHNGEIDVLLSNFPPGEVPPEVTLKPLFEIRTEFVVSADHPLASVEQPSLAEMHKARWAIVKHPHITNFLNSYFAAESLPPLDVAVETTSLVSLKSLVTTGEYIAMLPHRWIKDELAEGTLTTLRTALVREAGLIVRPDETLRPTVINIIPEVERACVEWAADRQ